jgi:uncharacterized cofD-like protein
MRKIVALGGGHGLSMLLRVLNTFDIDLTGIVNVVDDGGSSGRIREDIEITSPGDVRLCALALSSDSNDYGSAFRDIFSFRFDKGELDGHSLGNLILVALTRQLGSFEKAVEKASELLEVKGKVLPASVSDVVLCANTKNGLVRGQVNVENSSEIQKVFLDPIDIKPLDGVIDSINNADQIFYAPGSLFSSVLPSLLIEDINKALWNSKANITMILNLTNKGPDTYNMTGDDQLKVILDHGARVDSVLCDNNSLTVTKPPKGCKVQLAKIGSSIDVHDESLLAEYLKDEYGFN